MPWPPRRATPHTAVATPPRGCAAAQLVARKERLLTCLDDVMLLHSLGARVVVVCGASALIDAHLRSRRACAAGWPPDWLLAGCFQALQSGRMPRPLTLPACLRPTGDARWAWWARIG